MKIIFFFLFCKFVPCVIFTLSTCSLLFCTPLYLLYFWLAWEILPANQQLALDFRHLPPLPYKRCVFISNPFYCLEPLTSKSKFRRLRCTIPSKLIPSMPMFCTVCPCTVCPCTVCPCTVCAYTIFPCTVVPARFVPAWFIPARFVPARFVPARFVPARFFPAQFFLCSFSGKLRNGKG